MKIFALGGYGKVGFPAIKLLAQSDLITEITVAGRNLERAEKAATKIGEKGVAVQADGSDEEKLTSLLAGCDIVMNGANDGTVLPTIRAAIRTGTQYCDANVANEQALQLTSEAEAAGITSIVATGICPCISNLMGVHAARQLEEVEQLQLGFSSFFNWESGRDLTPRQWLEEPEESLAALQEFRPFIAWMLQMAQEEGSRTACIYHDDLWVETDPVRSGMDVPMTQGGTLNAYPYFSSAPLFGSLPNDLSRLSPVEMFFSPLPPQLHDLLREHALHELGGEMDSGVATNSFYDTFEKDPPRWLTLPDDFVTPPLLWVHAAGRKEGRAARCSCWFTAPIWNVGVYFLTSAALAVAVRKILCGEIGERGVMTAEIAFEPLSFFDEVAAVLPEPLPDGKLIGDSFKWLQ